MFSIFGPGTFNELNGSLTELMGKDASISSRAFREEKKIEETLKSLFKKTCIERKVYKEEHASLPALLKKIKYSGVRGPGIAARKVWSRGMLNKLEKVYKKNFGKI